MLRISGVVLNNKKQHIVIALRKIYGIGKINSIYICEKAKVNRFTKVIELTNKEIISLQKVISDFEVEGSLRTKIRMNIKRLKDIKCYRGFRHKMNLPTRGQRTKTNAKIRKKK